jgi:DNA repair protein RadD
MAKILRDYQRQAVTECWDALKKNDEPVLLMASVGAGKSLMLADILLTMQKAGKRALCLVDNAELVRNNCETFREEGGNSSIYCAALNCKDDTAPVVFGTPQSVLNGITKERSISKIKFNLIVVDEAHNINFNNHRSCFMRILRHYKHLYEGMRLLGATGTNFRFKGTEIVGEKCLFKTQVGNITTERLIKEGYLVEPTFEVDPELVIDFSRVKIKQNGLFDQKQLANVVDQNHRLTKLICDQIIHIMESQNRFGVFLFATTKKHAREILSYLPADQSALILGETPQDERTEILDKARKGEIKYLVNIAIISVGVDVPAYDTLAYLRPTESLVLMVQTMGRALRLSPKTNKEDALVLDFAGNIERHKDWDNPLIMKAVAKTIEKDKPLVIKCPKCFALNTETARRCVGVTNDIRCDYFFEFKNCPNDTCQSMNDVAARHCRLCETELIDPNDKLNIEAINADWNPVDVLSAKYGISGTEHNFRINIAYECLADTGDHGMIYEYYTPKSEKARRVFYGQFVKHHCETPSRWYTVLHNRYQVQLMLQDVRTPNKLYIKQTDKGIKIKKKIFDEDAFDRFQDVG